jgi:hypothetical protein
VQVWTEGGLLLASFLQEGLMRPPRGWDGMAEANEGLAATVATTRALLGVGSDGSALRSLTAEGRTMLDRRARL